MSRAARPEDLAAIAGSLPGAELSTSWGDRPTWMVRGRGFVVHRAARQDAIDPRTGEPYDDLVVIRVPDEETKRALVGDEHSPFFTIPHFDRSLAVLLSLSRIGELGHDELVEVLTDAWATRAPATVVREHRPR